MVPLLLDRGEVFLAASLNLVAIFKKIDFIFKRSFRFTVKLSIKYREFPYFFYPSIGTTSPLSTSVTHLYYPKSVVYFWDNSWWCTFSGFGQIYNDMVCHYSIVQNNFTTLKICALPVYLSHIPYTWQLQALLLSP